jgi:nucleotide-binding universal stress UspA family protein
VDRPDPFERILCGVDPTGAGLDAIRQAVRLSRPESELAFVGVSESHLAAQAGMLASHAVEDIESGVRKALDDAQELAAGAETRFVRGRPDEALLQIAQEEQTTLIAVGSHEHRRATGMILGSVATRMLHDAPCSVLLARPSADPEDGFPKSIVAGVDGSPASLWAAEVAQELGQRLGASVRLLAAKGVGPLDIDLAGLEKSGLGIDFGESKPVVALLEASQETDLLVLGSRGLRGLRALGSVSERVAHQGHCSQLVLRSGP